MSGFVPVISTTRPYSFFNRSHANSVKLNGAATPVYVSTSNKLRNLRAIHPIRASIAVPDAGEQKNQQSAVIQSSTDPIHTVEHQDIDIADEDIPLYGEILDHADDDDEDEDEEEYDELDAEDEDCDEKDDTLMQEEEDDDFEEEDDEELADSNWEDDDEAELTNVAPTVSDYTVISEQDYTSVRNVGDIEASPSKYSEKEAEAFGSFSSVVDVNITVGGLLGIEDDENNDLFSGIKFEALLDNEQVLANLQSEMNISTMTHVQLAAIPRIQDGTNVVIQGHTGTGKTLGFVLPILEIIDTELASAQAVIIAPTRELAMQISQEVSKLTKNTDITSMALIGGANPIRQTEKLRKRSPHILIGTPGRLAELEESRAWSLKRVEMLVIDEVDQCLQAPFRESIERLYKYAPHHLQTVLVSATGDAAGVHEFVSAQFKDKKDKHTTLLRVGDNRPLPKNIRNWYTVVPQRLRLETFRKLMFASNPKVTKGICFVDTPRRADIILEHLHKMKINAVGLRGTADKFEREQVVKMFRKGTVDLLVTTEIAARGLDVTDVSHVFNLDIPTDADHYVHRAGRCGRVGKMGTVVTLVTPDKAFVIGKLSKQLNTDIVRMEPRNGIYDKPVVRSNNGGPKRERNNNNNNMKTSGDRTRGADNNNNDIKLAQTEAPPAAKRLGKTHQPAAAKNKKKYNNNNKETKGMSNSAKEGVTKVKAKKKPKMQPKSVPKRIRSKKGISEYAKKEGWVGNRA